MKKQSRPHTHFSAEEKRADIETLKVMHLEHDSNWLREGRALRLVERYVPEKEKRSILDCGASNGALLQELRQAGYIHLYASDFENFLRDSSVAEFRKADFNFEPLPFEDNSLDAITCFETIEHLENPMHFVREVARVLKPGGILIFSMPNIYNLYNRLDFLRKGDMFRYHEKNDHFAVFPKSVFNKIFLRRFVLLETTYDKGEFPYRWLTKLTYPRNELFGRSICRVLQKKS